MNDKRPTRVWRVATCAWAVAGCVFWTASWATASAATGITVVDDSGAIVTLAAPAHRVISLAPHATELIYAAGGANAIVAAVNYSDYPPAARALPRVGDNQALDLEKIAALKPDLLVVWRHGNVQRQIGALRALGIPMFLSEPKQLPDIAGDLRKLGALMGTGPVADHAANDFTARIDALRAQYAHRTTVSVFYQVWDNPVMTLSGAHMVSDVIRLCGGRNVFASLTPIAPTVSTEAVIAANPDVIMTGRYGDESSKAGSARAESNANANTGASAAGGGSSKSGGNSASNGNSGAGSDAGSGAGGSDRQTGPADTLPRSLDRWKAWPQVSAIAHDNLFAVNADWMDRPAPRIADGAAQMCADLDIARQHLGQ